MTLDLARAPGDGIGPEIVTAASEVVEAALAACGEVPRWHDEPVGAACIRAHGTPLRDGAAQRIRERGAVLLGAVGDPAFGPSAPVRPEQAILQLRAELGLFANLRPVRSQAIDVLIVRELTGGIYFGTPRSTHEAIFDGRPGREAVDTCRYHEVEIRRVAEIAMTSAEARRGQVVSVDKANVLATSRLWRTVTEEVARVHPSVRLEHRLVDSFAMDLVRTPAAFDVILTGNLFGDILSDLASVLVGSIGVLPSASLGAVEPGGRRVGLYEPIHGSAPDLAGTGRANPVGTIRSAAMMLRESYGQPDAADLIERATADVLTEGWGTPDLSPARAVSTAELARRIAAKACA